MQLTEERVYLGYSSRGIGVPHHHGRENGSRQVGIAMEQQLRAHILIHNRKQRVPWGWQEAFEILRS